MTAYLISDVTVRDPAAFEEYRSRAARSIERHGGRYLVRGGAVEVLEGERRPKTIIIVAFPDADAIRRWYASPDYAEALAFRETGLDRSLIMVEGV